MLRSLVRSRILRLFLLVAVALAVLGTFAGDASAARTPCGSSLTWSVRPSLVTPDDGPAAIAAAYEAVAGPARLDVTGGDAGTVRYLWIDRGTGDLTTPGTAQGTSLLGGIEFVQHAYAPGVEGDALRTQVLRDILRDLGVTSPTSGPTLSGEDAAALAAVCAAAPAPAPSVAPEDAPAAPPTDDAVPAPADDAPDEDAPADGPPADDADAPAPALSKTIGLALVAVALAGVALYTIAPAVLSRLRRRQAAPDAAAASTS